MHIINVVGDRGHSTELLAVEPVSSKLKCSPSNRRRNKEGVTSSISEAGVV